ncbi:hypothetical protein [Parasphingorhabdus pacifica]
MANPRRVSRTVLSTIGLFLLAGAFPATAGAAPEGSEHCNLDVRTGEQRCFATTRAAVEDAQQLTARAADDVIQATVFSDRDYGGDSLTVYGSGLCEKDGWVDYQLNLGDEWKDRVSSVQPWGKCWIWLYPEPDLGGDRDGPFKENTPYVGDLLNDRTQSIGLS